MKEVKMLREHFRDSQQKFASRIGISIRAVGYYENGRMPEPRALVDFAVAAAYGERPDLAQVFADRLISSIGLRRLPLRFILHEIKGVHISSGRDFEMDSVSL